jgi:ribonuclease BN (tRNA processing enzyme)
MKVTILGSGTATPSLKRNSSGLFIETVGANILLDMGPGSLRRMCEAGIDYRNIDLIILTHFHPDHVVDFISFLFASNYAYGPMRTDPFHVVGPVGLKKFHGSLVDIFGSWVIPSNNRMSMHEMSADSPDCLQIKDVGIMSRPAAHSFPSLSYRLEADGKSITISGDTDVSENLVDLAKGSHTLICECSLPDSMKAHGHLTPSEAGLIAAGADVARLILTHLYPPCESVDIVSQARRIFKGTVLKAEDLMTVDFNS